MSGHVSRCLPRSCAILLPPPGHEARRGASLRTRRKNEPHEPQDGEGFVSIEGEPYIDPEDFIEEFQGLLWRIEYAKSRIEYLNKWEIASLQDQTRYFLKDPELRRRLILPEDFHLFDDFMEHVRTRRRASVVFRVHAPDNRMAWIKLIGTPSEREPRYFFGFMLDVTETVQAALDMDKAMAVEQMAVDSAPYPALLADLSDMRILAVNTAGGRPLRRGQGPDPQPDAARAPARGRIGRDPCRPGENPVRARMDRETALCPQVQRVLSRPRRTSAGWPTSSRKSCASPCSTCSLPPARPRRRPGSRTGRRTACRTPTPRGWATRSRA